MRKLLLLVCALAVALPLTASIAQGQNTSTSTDTAAPRAKQEQMIGEVTAIDAASGQVTIKTDAGKTISVSTSDATAYLRIAPGEKSLTNAAKIARTDVAIGDRVLVRSSSGSNGAAADTQPVIARQLIVMSKQALAGREESNREDWRRRGIGGRIIALNPETKEATITARSRGGVQSVIISTSGEHVRLMRYAPDSMRDSDAHPVSFADLKVGDQLRARGERSADGSRFTPEEIFVGSFTRATGTVTGIDTAKGEITIKDEQAGKSLTIVVGKNSSIRRIPAEFVERMEQRRAEQQQRRAAAGGGNQQSGQPGERRNERASDTAGGANGDRRPRGGASGPGGGGGFQQMFENMPAITINDLKKGDVVIVNGTPAQNASRITAISVTTGDAALMKRLQQFQGRPNGQRNMSPGLPADAVGGGTGGERDRP
jgi:Cu/Ag efflux protein CusF